MRFTGLANYSFYKQLLLAIVSITQNPMVYALNNMHSEIMGF